MDSDYPVTDLPQGLPKNTDLPPVNEVQPFPGSPDIAELHTADQEEAAHTVQPLESDPSGQAEASPDQVAVSADEMTAHLVKISEDVERLAVSAEHYHARAAQREGVIDHLHAEVERLRRGERRGLLRPLLVEICRLRNDILRQAEDLPADFDADRTRVLLRSYAESIELTLEDSGVVTFEPEKGDRFEPRLHRRVGGEATGDRELAGQVARIRRSGYLDVDTKSPVAPAEVVLFVPAGTEPTASSGRAENTEPGAGGPDGHGPASATAERKEQ
jgi:molecular chaperone GrpE